MGTENNKSSDSKPKKKAVEEDYLADFGVIVATLLQEGPLSQEQVDRAQRVRSKIQNPPTFLDILKDLKYITDDEIRKAIRAKRDSLDLGSLLLELGLISAADLETGLSIQSKEKKKRNLGEILVDYHLIREHDLIKVLSQDLGFTNVNLESTQIDRKLFSIAPDKFCETRGLIPIREERGKVLVAFSDPMDQSVLKETRNIFRSEIVPVIAGKHSIAAAIKKIRPSADDGKSTGVDESAAVQIVDSVIEAAIDEGDVSDIHIEPMPGRVGVRFRQDGVLVHYKHFPSEMILPITSRIKIMCQADIAEKRRHQGGRIFFNHNGREIDLRVSLYVTIHGEKIVLRLLNRMSQLLNLEDIGMLPHMLKRYRQEALDRPSGVVIITGPTGSGKTTTVYSCINYLNSPQTSIITAEDPVEYIIERIAQCSINPNINLTFDETLRHIVRQDPDIILIGEIRDNFSAQVAVQAALTGHKVLTTFHTEDSIGGLIRLLNMNIEAFLISSTVVCVVAQRLVRRVCPGCKAPYTPQADELQRIGYKPADVVDAEFRRGEGCPLCRYSGYKGRVAIFEMLVLDERVRDGILNRKTSQEIRTIAIESTGLATLLEDGIVKAAEGLTTIEELLRCLPVGQTPRPIEKLRRILGRAS